jgi:S-adenosylmethionine synthetase
MESNDYIFTSESVSEGHPDKICDQLSDAVLDAHLKGDPKSRVACEALVKNSTVILAGEITSNTKVDYEAIARQVIREIGYTDPALGFDADGASILTFISHQSQDISQGVTEGEGEYKEQGAGDQGLMFGFACDETPELMPLPIALSHRILKKLSDIRRSDKNTALRPDAKSQVSVEYKNGKPSRIDTIVLSTQHTEAATLQQLHDLVVNQVIPEVIPTNLLDKNTKYLVNPTGRFVIGGPVGDCGLTGRNIIVDTYGGYARHGGGAFSGKDPTKVDRSAAYAARYIAKNIVAAGLASKCEVQVAYAIGVAKPVSIYVNTYGTGTASEAKISAAVSEVFDLTPRGIIDSLNLLRPIYQPTASYGHFGREASNSGLFSWERTDKVEALKSALK